MEGPHFPQLVESFSCFVYPGLDISIGTPVNADYTTFLQDNISLIVIGLLLEQRSTLAYV